MGKRDRWDSSSDEDEGGRGRKNQNGANCVANNNNTINKISKTTSSSSSGGKKKKTGEESDDQNLENNSKKYNLPLHNPLLQGCRSVYDTYERLDRVSEGTYGVVWKAKDLATEEIVALKQIQ